MAVVLWVAAEHGGLIKTKEKENKFMGKTLLDKRLAA